MEKTKKNVHPTHEELISKIRNILSPFSKRLYVEKKDGVGLIQVFKGNDLTIAEYSYRIAFADILLLDDKDKGNPLMVIEPETSFSPKTFGRSIFAYTIANEIKIGRKRMKIKLPLLLMIVIPDDKNDIYKRRGQLEDLQYTFKNKVGLEKSQLRDFRICQISDFKETIKGLLNENGHSADSRKIDKIGINI